uniref:Uncharacterized protein n=1 Tax=Buteo japonicus TaxID=224669 RepID=A0A8C0B5H8_9AVES
QVLLFPIPLCGLDAKWTKLHLPWNLFSLSPVCPSLWIFHTPFIQRMQKLCGTQSKKLQGRSFKKRWMSLWTAFTLISTDTLGSTCQLQNW